MHQLKVFVSSTCYDLKQIRKDLSEFLSNQGYQPIMSEFDSFPIDPNTDTIANCIKNVEGSDLFVLVIGGRYGYVLENGKSITNMEYIYAKKMGIPVFVYIYRDVTSALGLYQDNPDGNFLQVVDDTKVFDFVNDVRNVNQDWCYDFDHAQDITSNLRIRFSHLFADSLSIRARMHSDDQDELWEVISPKATAIALRKQNFFELDFLRQVIRDELDRYKGVRFDEKYEIFLGSAKTISSCNETIVFLRHSFHEVKLITQSAGNIMNSAFDVFWGELGVAADLYGLYYVANRLAKVYFEMVKWSIKLKTTNVPVYFEQAMLLTADFNKLSAENLWNYPNQIERALEEVINLDNSQSDNPVVKAHLNFEIDDKLLQKYSTEMERLTEFFQQNPELYD